MPLKLKIFHFPRFRRVEKHDRYCLRERRKRPTIRTACENKNYKHSREQTGDIDIFVSSEELFELPPALERVPERLVFPMPIVPH